MKWLIFFTVILSPGCSVYTVASVTSTIVTGKSIPDHSATLATQNDCSSIKFITGEKDYYCEHVREPGTTYNRNTF